MLSLRASLLVVILLAGCQYVFPYPEAPVKKDAALDGISDGRQLDRGPLISDGVGDSARDGISDGAGGDRGSDLSSTDGPISDGPEISPLQWKGKFFGSVNIDTALAVAVDDGGNVYLTGRFSGDMSIQGMPWPDYQGGFDVFVASFDPAGDLRWVKGFGGNQQDEGRSIAVSSSGVVHVTGFCTGASVRFDQYDINCSNYDIFWAQLDSSNGDPMGLRSYGQMGPGFDIGYGVAVDASNAVYLTGMVSGDTDFGNGLVPSGGNTDIFLVKFDQNNNTEWSYIFSSDAEDVGHGVAVSNGVVYVTGQVGGDIDFGGGLQHATDSDLFLAAFETVQGGNSWSRVVGGSGKDVGYAVAANSSAVYITGQVEGGFTFEIEPLDDNSSADMLVASYDLDGDFNWVESLGGPGIEVGRGIALGQNGSIYIAGHYDNSFTINGQIVPHVGDLDLLVKSYDADGQLRWLQPLGSSNPESAWGIATYNNAGKTLIYTVGEMNGDLIVDGDIINSIGGSDCLVLSLEE